MCDGKILDWEDEEVPEFVTEVPQVEVDLSALIKLMNAKKNRAKD